MESHAYAPPEALPRPRARKKEKAPEAKESGFEAAKRELMEFLNTPSRFAREQLKAGLEKGENYRDGFLLDVFEDKLKKVVECCGDKKPAAVFLTDLATKMYPKRENIPPVFLQTKEDVALFHYIPEYINELPNFYPDIFQHGVYLAFAKTNTTFRTHLYDIVIKMLDRIGPAAEENLLTCLKHMDGSVVGSPNLNAEMQENHNAALDAIATDKFGELAQDPHGDYYSSPDEEFLTPRRHALESIDKNVSKPSPEVVDYVVNVFEKHTDYGTGTYFRLVKSICNKNPGAAADSCIRYLQQEKPKLHKAIVTRLLYHLELGKINMSTKGVEYLGKVFDLGADNTKGAFAHRATADGRVAIFDDKGNATGYFQLTGLDTPDKVVQARFLEFTYETLFYPKPDETPEERAERMAILEDFKKNYFKTYLQGFYEQTHTAFNNLSFREQGWFLWYVQHASAEDKTRAMNFVKEYGEDGLKTFLSLEQDRQNGERIVALGERLDMATAAAVFKKYSELAQAAEAIATYMQHKFGADRVGEHQVTKAADALLRQAKDMLLGIAEITQHGKPSDQREVVVEKLRSLRRDVMLFATTFKIALESGSLDFKDIAGVAIETKASETLTPEEKKQMQAVFKTNRVSNPTDYPPELLAGRLQDFKKLLDEEGKKFYLLKDGEAVVAFVHYEDKADEKGQARYLGSFNVDPSGRGKKIGSAFLQTTLEAEGGHRRVILNVNGGNQYLDSYLNRFGFTVQRVDPNYRGSGKQYYFLERLPPGQKQVVVSEQ